MKLFYTGADTYLAEQKDKDKSLGGFLSSTQIPNDFIDNMFGDISYYGLDKKLRETRGIILKNDTGATVTSVNFYYDIPAGTAGKFEVAAVALSYDSCNEIVMEQINSIRSGPYIGTFVEANGIGNKVLISASFPTDNYIGLWIRRVIEDTDMDPFSCDTLYNNYIAGTPLTTEVAPTINVEWT